jgi:hypothetical protein
MAQLLEAGVYFVTRARGYHVLEHPQIQGALAHPPTARVTRVNSDEVVELFDGGWLQLDAGLSQTRVIVARHYVPAPGKRVSVGKCIGEWVYELFVTTLPSAGFLVEEVLDLYHGRGAFEAVLADEDLEEDPDRWCSYTECGQELWQVACQWVWNLRLSLGQTMQGGKTREIEWAPVKAAPPFLVPEESPPQEYGPWQQAVAFGRAAGRLGADTFVLQEDGTLRCPAGASLWLSEVRQENAFTQRAVYVASQMDCPHCTLREQCLGRHAKGIALVGEVAVRRLLPSPLSVEQDPHLLAAMRWVDVAGRALRRTWIAHWRRKSRRNPSSGRSSTKNLLSTSSSSLDPFSSSLELARSARTQCLVGATASAHYCCWRSRFSCCQRALGETNKSKETLRRSCISLRNREGGDSLSPSSNLAFVHHWLLACYPC